MRSALVAGASGFIGANLVRNLLASGIETTAFVRSGSPRRGRVEGLAGVQTLLVENYRFDELLRALDERTFDVVYNALGSGTSHGERRWEVLIDGNVIAALAVARVAGRCARRFVHVGTCSEYGAKPADARPLAESDPIAPLSEYGASKAAARPPLAQACRAAGIAYVHARLFNTYGPFESETRLVPYIVRRLSAGEPAELTDGSQVRDFTFVADTCEGLRSLGACALAEEAPVFNVCSGVPVTVREVATAIADALGAPRALLRFAARPQRRDEPLSLVGTNARLRDATGWMPTTPLARGIERVDHAYFAKPESPASP